jgi:hypothetical protein
MRGDRREICMGLHDEPGTRRGKQELADKISDTVVKNDSYWFGGGDRLGLHLAEQKGRVCPGKPCT